MRVFIKIYWTSKQVWSLKRALIRWVRDNLYRLNPIWTNTTFIQVWKKKSKTCLNTWYHNRKSTFLKRVFRTLILMALIGKVNFAGGRSRLFLWIKWGQFGQKSAQTDFGCIWECPNSLDDVVPKGMLKFNPPSLSKWLVNRFRRSPSTWFTS